MVLDIDLIKKILENKWGEDDDAEALHRHFVCLEDSGFLTINVWGWEAYSTPSSFNITARGFGLLAKLNNTFIWNAVWNNLEFLPTLEMLDEFIETLIRKKTDFVTEDIVFQDNMRQKYNDGKRKANN